MTTLLLAAVAGLAALDGSMHHLGTPGEPEWSEFARDRAEGQTLEVRFSTQPNREEATLLLRQRNVKLDWPVSLNGKPLGLLIRDESDLIHALAIPAGSLREGENVVRIGPAPGVDDIVVGELTLDARPRTEALNRATIEVRVSDNASGYPVPSRITVLDDRGTLVPLMVKPDPTLAIRTGVVYTLKARVRLGVRAGKFTVHATRGPTYSLATKVVSVAEGGDELVYLAIQQEVDTRDLIACDTHTHTLTHSGHGDSTVSERVVTLAGEGIDLAVATDHDHLTDLGPEVRKLGLGERLATIVGDEVTTRRGHFNAWPFAAGDPVPDPKLGDWSDLFRALRRGSDARLIVLNHPRDEHAGFRPFGPENFNEVTGELRPGVGFDAVEVINSSAMASDPLRLVRDWFALWNHGHPVTAVGASDSHDVSRFIVGQGRTYLISDAAIPGETTDDDLREATEALRAGKALVSLGLLTRLKVNEKYGPGDLATNLGDTLTVTATVQGPSWLQADRVELFVNGVKVREQRIRANLGATKDQVTWALAKPAHDVALVAIASGPGTAGPFWPLARPYQPTSRDWEPRVFGLTNPVRIDGDGDGSWSSPRYYAQLAIELAGTEPTALFRFLGRFDEAVATQAAAFLHAPGGPTIDPSFAASLKTAPEAVRRGFTAFEAARTPRDR